NRPGIRGIEKPSFRYSFIGWNGRRPPLDDPRVRRALTLAIDRDEILRAFRGGHGRSAIGPVPPGHWAFAERVRPLPNDPQRARRLLEEAGLRGATGETRRDPAGRALSFQLLVPAGNDQSRDLAQRIQADLAAVGAEIRIRPVDFGALVQIITGPERDFDAVLLALDADPRLDLRALFHSDALDGPFQVAGYRDAGVDSLLDAIETTPDRAAARTAWVELQRVLNR
ncbi:MAG: hypothetical protein GWM90_01780, partial [Gemmatimonadetes bacterium]|nr:hypothetical protein [Gemmatimonadota bacterium]NIQ59056.1 hypothetical protein [Gemmatimonadota bacterium]NIU72440.1 hypothetical protein [Gammaproteobacteria bacterium]NIX42900.1 hypothetical protein [Gemmatimonadota bacterium]NIY12309.1 hypothetical protein [Gemmatimonadota bacterium]